MKRFVLLLGLLIAVAGCDSDTTGTSGGGTGPSGGTSSAMSARIDGQSWAASPTTISASNITGVITIAGAEAGGTSSRIITLTVVATTPGTYPIGPPPVSAPATNAFLSAGAAQWAADTSRGSGFITLQSLNANGAIGTYQFTAAPIVGTTASGDRVVTDGSFNVRF